jgi:hypothetical protein
MLLSPTTLNTFEAPLKPVGDQANLNKRKKHSLQASVEFQTKTSFASIFRACT